MKERRRPTAKEWRMITSPRPVVRKIPKERLPRPSILPTSSPSSVNSPAQMRREKC